MAATTDTDARTVVSVTPAPAVEYRLRAELAYHRAVARAAADRLALALKRPAWCRRLLREALVMLREGS